MNKINRDRSWLGLVGLSLVLMAVAGIGLPALAQDEPAAEQAAESAPENPAPAEADVDAPAKSETDAAPAEDAPSEDGPSEKPESAEPKPADEATPPEPTETDTPAEEPAAEDPAPAKEEPAAETPESKTEPETPAAEEPTTEEPATDEPAAEAPADTEEAPATEDSATDTNTEDDPGKTDVGGAPIDPEKALADAESEEVSTGEIVEEQMSTMQMLGIAFASLALIIVPFYIGSVLGTNLRMPDHGWKIGLILGTITWAAVITWLGWPPKLGPDLSGGINLIYEIDPQADSENLDVDKMINALVLRVNPGGVKEVTIRQYGPKQIEIIIPKAGEAELDAIKRQISTAGSLQFRITANTKDHKELIESAFESDDNDIYDGEELVGHWSYIDLKRFDLIVNSSDSSMAGLIAEARATRGSAVGDSNRVEAYWLELDPSEIPEDQRRNAVLRRNARGGLEVLVMSQQARESGGYILRSTPQGRPQVLVVIDEYNVTGAMLDSAASNIDEQGRSAVGFTFKTLGTDRFARFTTENGPDAVGFKQKLGILLDDTLLSAPTLNEPITGGMGQISGNFSEEDIDFLVSILNAGSLPAALNKVPISEQTTSPELGLDTIRKGTTAMAVSMIVVIIFMLLYYRFCGILACLALGTNLLLLLALMISIKAAFTLPGLAGLVLTVGMAVDANVLIFERIREELGRGAALRMAIRNGFERATTAIVDSNITTLITSIVLFLIGTDQIKGFAVTLILGILMSMYTAIFCTRVVFDIFERHRWITKLSMVKIFDKANFNFLGKRNIALALSALIIGIGLVAMVTRGRNILDIDFVGGSSVTVNFREAQDITDVRKHVEDAVKALEASIDDVKAEAEKAKPEITQQVKDRLTSDPGFKDKSESEQQDSIDFEVSRQLSLKYPEIDVVVPVDYSVVGIGEAHLDYKIDTSIVDFTLAQRILSDEFGDKLVRNELKYEFVGDSEMPAEGGEAPVEPAEKEDPGVSRTPLPGPDEYALADDVQLALLQDDTATDAAPADAAVDESAPEKPEDAPAETPEPDAKEPAADTPAETPAEKPAAEESSETETAATDAESDESKPAEKDETIVEAVDTDSAQYTTTAKLNFGQPINHDSVADLIEEAMETSDEIPSASFSVLSRDADYTPGSELRMNDWEISIGLDPETTQKLLDHVAARVSEDPVFPSSSNIGGKVAGDTQELAAMAMLVSLVAIVAYIWFRFSSVMFGLAAVAALVHDVLIMLGMIALSSFVVDSLPFISAPLLIDPFKISLPIVAALLTVVGYSLNDTIVIFDRIREVRGKSPDLTADMMNISINQSLSRTVLTSLTTLFVVVTLYFMGGPGIHGFAFALVIGVIAGTYSTVFIACPVLDWLSNSGKDAKKTA